MLRSVPNRWTSRRAAAAAFWLCSATKILVAFFSGAVGRESFTAVWSPHPRPISYFCGCGNTGKGRKGSKCEITHNRRRVPRRPSCKVLGKQNKFLLSNFPFFMAPPLIYNEFEFIVCFTCKKRYCEMIPRNFFDTVIDGKVHENSIYYFRGAGVFPNWNEIFLATAASYSTNSEDAS